MNPPSPYIQLFLLPEKYDIRNTNRYIGIEIGSICYISTYFYVIMYARVVLSSTLHVALANDPIRYDASSIEIF
jgi:hypothetical protein